MCVRCAITIDAGVIGAPLVLADYTVSKINVFGVPHLFTCKSPNNLAVHAETELLIKRRQQHLKAKAFFMSQFPPGPRVSHWGLFELLRKFAAKVKDNQRRH